MKFQLIDKNKELCDQWSLYFEGFNDVEVINGDALAVKTDCIVSPANSFGFMDGGFDFYITKKLGQQVQQKLKKIINDQYYGELLIGQAVLIETENEEIPFCISAPTMRIPTILVNTVNVYLASKAIFALLKNETRFNTVTISGLGTGIGRVPLDVCAKQMRQAYDDVWLNQHTMPSTWLDAQVRHQRLYTTGEMEDLQH